MSNKNGEKRALTKAERSEKMKWTIGVICVIAVFALVIGLVAYNKISTSGFIQRHTTAMSTADGNFSVSEAMLEYYYNANYQTFVNNYSDSLSTYGIDTQKSLKSQVCPLYSDGTTWHDYFMKNTRNSVSQMLAYAECAKAEGLTLSEDDMSEIEASISNMENFAKLYGVNINYYISSSYGNKVNKDVVRDCLELSAIASLYQNHVIDGYEFTDDEINTYYNENLDSFMKIDYVWYDFDADIDDDADDAAKQEAKDQAARYADELAGMTDEASFVQYIRDHMTNVQYADDESADIDEKMEEVYVTGAAKSTGDFYDKAFADDVQPYTVFTDSDDENGCYKVYMVLPGEDDSLPYAVKYRNEYTTKNVRHILFTESEYGSIDDAKAKAEEILAQWQTGDATGESFGELAHEYSADSGSSELGGLYENVLKNVMVTEFNDWIYDENRHPGDTGIIETTNGIHLMYFEGDGKTAWIASAENYIAEARYEEDSVEALKAHPTVFNEKAISGVNNVTFSQNNSNSGNAS